MSWLKIRFCTIVVWCRSLLYLRALVSVACGSGSILTTAVRDGRRLLRTICTIGARPDVLVAMTTSTRLYGTREPPSPWLRASLALVGQLFLGHGVRGMMVSGESDPFDSPRAA